jgi:hypothetical protein
MILGGSAVGAFALAFAEFYPVMKSRMDVPSMVLFVTCVCAYLLAVCAFTLPAFFWTQRVRDWLDEQLAATGAATAMSDADGASSTVVEMVTLDSVNRELAQFHQLSATEVYGAAAAVTPATDDAVSTTESSKSSNSASELSGIDDPHSWASQVAFRLRYCRPLPTPLSSPTPVEVTAPNILALPQDEQAR